MNPTSPATVNYSFSYTSLHDCGVPLNLIMAPTGPINHSHVLRYDKELAASHSPVKGHKDWFFTMWSKLGSLYESVLTLRQSICHNQLQGWGDCLAFSEARIQWLGSSKMVSSISDKAIGRSRGNIQPQEHSFSPQLGLTFHHFPIVALFYESVT